MPLSSLAPASQAAYSWLQTPALPNDAVPGGYFVTGSDYVKVGRRHRAA